jgi:hypothetical protein
METSIAQRNALPGSFEDYLSHAGLIQNALIAMSGPQQAPPMATLLYTGEDSPTQTPEPSGAPRNTSEDFTINGLDFEYSQEIDTALYEARALLSPILAKMCPTITKKGRKPLPITDWVRNSAKNRTHMDAIGNLALQSELIQLAQDDQCTELERVVSVRSYIIRVKEISNNGPLVYHHHHHSICCLASQTKRCSVNW